MFDLRKIFAVPKDFLKSKIYCTLESRSKVRWVLNQSNHCIQSLEHAGHVMELLFIHIPQYDIKKKPFSNSLKIYIERELVVQYSLAMNGAPLGAQRLGVVHKLRLQDEVVRWFKNVHFLSTFIPQKMSKKSQNFVNVICEQPPKFLDGFRPLFELHAYSAPKSTV